MASQSQRKYHKKQSKSIKTRGWDARLSPSQWRDKQRLEIYRYIKSCGKTGATCDEIEQALNISHQSASARCSEIRKYKHVAVPRLRKTRSGYFAGVLVAISSKGAK